MSITIIPVHVHILFGIYFPNSLITNQSVPVSHTIRVNFERSD